MAEVDRQQARQDFIAARPKLHAFAGRLTGLVAELCVELRVHAVNGRAKDENSFHAKSLKKDSGGLAKYKDPLKEIEDLVGVRIICFTNTQVGDVGRILEQEFSIHEIVDKERELNEAGRVGYVSKHFIVSLSEGRKALPEWKSFSGIKAEIQVRTVFQHAWAEVEHRLQYKGAARRPELDARFQALAGLVQIADREFESLFDLEREISSRIKEAVDAVDVVEDESDDLEAQHVDPNSQQNHALSEVANLYGVPARHLVEQGRFREAIQTYDGLVSMQPNQVWHYIGRAKARSFIGDFDGAREDLRAAKRIAPDGNNRIQNAIARLERALAISQQQIIDGGTF